MTFDKKKYDNKYQKDNYDRIALNVKKGYKEVIRQHAQQKGYETITEYINALINADMENAPGGGKRKQEAVSNTE